MQVDARLKKELALAYLQARYAEASAHSTALTFWQAEPMPPDALTFSRHVRSGLIAIFGDAAQSDPLFQEYFQPLRRQLPFLSPAKQVAVAEALSAGRTESERLARELEMTEQPLAMAKAAEKTDGAIRNLLTPEEYSEYSVRMSALAEAIRRLNLGLNEQEFRALFARIESDAELKGIIGRTQPLGQPSSRLYSPAIASILGQERLVKLLRQYDPVYFLMARSASGVGISTEQISAAYAETVDSELRIADLRSKGDVRGVRSELSRQRDRLNKLLGPQAGMMFGTLMAGLEGEQPMAMK
jgi:hypothetical protein